MVKKWHFGVDIFDPVTMTQREMECYFFYELMWNENIDVSSLRVKGGRHRRCIRMQFLNAPVAPFENMRMQHFRPFRVTNSNRHSPSFPVVRLSRRRRRRRAHCYTSNSLCISVSSYTCTCTCSLYYSLSSSLSFSFSAIQHFLPTSLYCFCSYRQNFVYI